MRVTSPGKMKQTPDQQSMLARILRRLVRLVVVLLFVALAFGLCVAYACLIEPHWLKVRRVSLADDATVRLIHVTDIHYKGDREYLEKVVDVINATEADFVCFTGDLVEELDHLHECLSILSRVSKRVYGVPGNHDHWAGVSTREMRTAFQQTGGDWLNDANVLVANGTVELVGDANTGKRVPKERLSASAKRVLLIHDPGFVGGLQGETFDLILSGHTHGGQVRIPLIGHRIIPYEISHYDRGLFQTDAGPLYVNPGIGTFYMDVRFRCRPEITVIEL